jgi:hypothetical protein
MNRRLGLTLALTSITSGCCRIQVDELGVPLTAQVVRVRTPSRGPQLANMIVASFRKHQLDMHATEANSWQTEPRSTTLGVALIRFQVAIQGSTFTVVPEQTGLNSEWEKVEPSSVESRAAFAYLVNVFAELPALSIDYQTKPTFWCTGAWVKPPGHR